jgi:hypothetical protein
VCVRALVSERERACAVFVGGARDSHQRTPASMERALSRAPAVATHVVAAWVLGGENIFMNIIQQLHQRDFAFLCSYTRLRMNSSASLTGRLMHGRTGGHHVLSTLVGRTSVSTRSLSLYSIALLFSLLSSLSLSSLSLSLSPALPLFHSLDCQ